MTEVRERVAFHLQGGGLVRSDPEEILDRLEAFPPPTVLHVETGNRAERVEVPPVFREDSPVRLQGLRPLIQPLVTRGLALECRDVRWVQAQRLLESGERGLVGARRDESPCSADQAVGRLRLTDRWGPRNRPRRF